MKRAFTLIFLLSSIAAGAQTWTGAVSSNWFTAGNWSPATVPGSSSAVTIPGFAANAPILSANVTVGSLTMTTGALLNLAAYSFTANGSLSLGSATVSGGGSFTVSSPGSVSITSSSLTSAVSITGITGSTTITGNTFTGATTLGTASSQATNSNYLGGNTFTGSLTLTHGGSGTFYESYGTANNVTGNAIFNISGSGTFYSSYNIGLTVGGNLSVSRTVAGSTYLFYSNAPASVGGSFSYSSVGGRSDFNSGNANNVTIGGAVNISAGVGAFNMDRLVNSTAGGTITVTSPTSVSISRDSLIASLSITGITSSVDVRNNSFTGAATLTTAASQATNANYFGGNLITGNLTLTHGGTGNFYEGYSASGYGDRITGNAAFNMGNTGTFYSGYTSPHTIGGSLSASRTVAGSSVLFYTNGAYSIGGDFTYTSAGGATDLNSGNTALVAIGGAVNITVGTGSFTMYALKNGLAGGAITVTGPTSLSIHADTLKAITSITSITASTDVRENSFTGDANFSTAASQATNANYFGGNLFTGNLTLTHGGTGIFYEAYSAAYGDRVTGNAAFNAAGTGTFYSGYTLGLIVGGSLSVNRSVGGNTYLFYNANPYSIGGDFSYVSTSGATNLNSGNATGVSIGGAINISAGSGSFSMYRLKNGVAGGTVSVVNPSAVELRFDTLIATTSIAGYTSAADIRDNSFTGAATIASGASQANNANYIGGNLFDGALTLVHNGSSIMYESYTSASGLGNVVTGRDSIVNAGSGNINVSYTYTHEARGTFVQNAAAGISIAALRLGGSGAAAIRNIGSQALSIGTLTIARSGSAPSSLEAPLSVTGSIVFSTGYLQSSTGSPLKFANGVTYSGAGNASHVVGVIERTGSTAFTFPLGNGAAYSPIGITAPGVATDVFRAQYVKVQPNAAGYDSSLHDASINHISRNEFWLLNRVNGTSNAKVILGTGLNSGYINDMSKLTVAHWYNNGTSTAWHDEGNGGTTGTPTNGTVQSLNTVTSFSPFTLASTTTANPLPIRLLRFEATRKERAVLLQWTSANASGHTRYTVERSSDGSHFDGIGGTDAAGPDYGFTDAKPQQGANYYRLLMTEADGGSERSVVRTVYFNTLSTLILAPNPASTELMISGLSGKSATLEVRDASGRMVYRREVGDEQEPRISVEGWPAGSYYLSGKDEDGAIPAQVFLVR